MFELLYSVMLGRGVWLGAPKLAPSMCLSGVSSILQALKGLFLPVMSLCYRDCSGCSDTYADCHTHVRMVQSVLQRLAAAHGSPWHVLLQGAIL